MPATLKFVRGSTLRFKTYFVDIDGNVTLPPSAKVYVSYLSSPGVFTGTSFDLVSDGLKYWTYDWDTRSIMSCEVDWSIVPAGSKPVAREDGTFTLTANRANPVP